MAEVVCRACGGPLTVGQDEDGSWFVYCISTPGCPTRRVSCAHGKTRKAAIDSWDRLTHNRGGAR